MNELRVGHHLYLLSLGANREMDRNRGSLIDGQDDALLNVFLKALGLDLQMVVTDRKFEQDISAPV